MKAYLEDFIPSLFVVTSPFQALCAVEAIETMKIGDYKFIACVIGDTRDEQLYKFLNERKIKYTIENFKNIRYSTIFLKPLFQKERTYYKRAFLGDIDNFRQRHVAYKFLSNNSYIAYLDDGTKDIPYLMGKRKVHLSKYSFFEFLIRKMLRIQITRSHFTMFSDIALSSFECKTNRLSHIANRIRKNDFKDVFYIGTNSYMYCKKLNIPITKFNEILETHLDDIKNKYRENTIYYIPHGMDQNPEIRCICKRKDVVYLPVDKTVELFILDLPSYPRAIYSNTSTALFTVKLLCPQTDVYNIFCLGDPNSKYYSDYLSYSMYFKRHGIPILTENLMTGME